MLDHAGPHEDRSPATDRDSGDLWDEHGWALTGRQVCWIMALIGLVGLLF